MSDKRESMFAVLCESENGVDAFGNPKGKIILMEAVGEALSYSSAIDSAKMFRDSGRFGRVAVVTVTVKEILF